jgi:hypothetical protein
MQIKVWAVNKTTNNRLTGLLISFILFSTGKRGNIQAVKSYYLENQLMK